MKKNKYILNVVCYLGLLTFSVVVITSNGCNNDSIYISYDGDKDYTNCLQDAISKHKNIIINSGKYRISKPLILNDNTAFIGEGDVILIKENVFSHILVNQQASKDFTTKWNKNITIKNLTFDVNNNSSRKGAIHNTANGNLSFKFVENLILEDIRIINSDKILFGIHLQSVRNVSIKNFIYNGEKDGIHINGGSTNLLIDGFQISSYDDAFGIMTDDYPRVQHNTKDIRNIIIKNGVSLKRYPQSGFFIRFLTGSWKEWKKGNYYNIGHIVNVDKYQYKKVNPGNVISKYKPIHFLGDSIYPDGIIWRFIGEGNNFTSNIYNISISNIKLKDNRGIVRTVDNDSYNNNEYPGTENSSIVDSIYIENYSLIDYKGRVGYYIIYRFKKNYVYLLILNLVFVLILASLILIYFIRWKNQFEQKKQY